MKSCIQKRYLLNVCGLLVWVGIFGANAQTQSSEQAPQSAATGAPQYKVGDSFTVGNFDLWRQERDKAMSRTSTVVEVSDKLVRFESVNENGTKGGATTTPEGHFVSNTNFVATPFQKRMQFPLVVGQEFEDEHQMKDVRSGVIISRKVKVKLVAAEKITTKAGTFDAFKFVQEGKYTRSDFPGQGRWNSTYFYAPAVRAVVHETFESTDLRGQRWNHYTNELEAFELAK